jgi:hypothetical protein
MFSKKDEKDEKICEDETRKQRMLQSLRMAHNYTRYYIFYKDYFP